MQCYIDGSISNAASHTNVFIANNIIVQGVNFDTDDNGTFQNNIMHATGAAYSSGFTEFYFKKQYPGCRNYTAYHLTRRI